ncbi:hypothetical protein F9K33_06315 [bacterium]|nr:MAG: hypothetical protein F9K33_06315 [bacterium]
MNSVKFLIIEAFIFIFFCSSATSAQDGKTESFNSIHKSRWAFQLSDDFSSVILQLKYHVSNNTAIRYGILFGLGGTDGKGSFHRLPVDTITSKSKNEYDDYTISNRVEFLYYPYAEDHFALYSGFGPELGFSQSKGINKHGDPNYSGKSEMTSKSWYTGINLLMGLEWFPTKKVSLFTEYELYAYFQSAHQTYSGESTSTLEPESWGYKDKYKNTGYRTGSNGMRLGLSLYW